MARTSTADAVVKSVCPYCAVGGSLLAASAMTRFGIFEAGLASARDPKYTIVPQLQAQRRP